MTNLRIIQMSEFLGKCELALGESSLSWESYLRLKPALFTITTVLSWVLMVAVAGYGTSIGLGLMNKPLTSCVQSKPN